MNLHMTIQHKVSLPFARHILKYNVLIIRRDIDEKISKDENINFAYTICQIEMMNM